ncbi:uncharacterized protein C8A04DRAFT_28283 [Dichotomopilus funicola]|uniref:Uncharacterized protein n=1 Tax=Dichotomopilus funicola TaxID=1934379 RepID=A0AAN6V4I5_9PEZI|nr:hypothetical protein C8A04DRAFT_28283 [Dichotomopilus funicola]
MDDPSDCSWTWPFWKFGLKKDDLFGALHERYNTVPSPILDPEAFHHDVYELSQKAANPDEFHNLLQSRKEQRLRELNETLESAAVEIIANPTLIGTEQWQYAVQLFRTKSLDSLVRYYASYLPSDHPWYKSASSSTSSETGSVGSLTDSHGSFEDEEEEIPFMDEPFEYPSYPKQAAPLSPRSMTMCSDSSVASPIGASHHEFDFEEQSTPARTLSFSESEPDCCAMSTSGSPCGCEEDSNQSSTSTTASRSVTHGGEHIAATPSTEPSTSGAATLPKHTLDTTDSETPTPKPETHTTSSFFADTKATPSQQRRHRSLSPSRPHPLSERDLDQVLSAHRDPRNAQRLQLSRREKGKERERERECSPAMHRRRRGSPGESSTRIQKPLAEVGRSRPRTRKWAEGS